MATIVNERDVILQAAPYRIVETQVVPGVQVTQDQVQGLGLVVLNAKLVLLSANSQIFKIPKPAGGTQGLPTPQIITLTPTIKNLPQMPTFKVIAGICNFATANGQALIGYADLQTDTATFRCSVTDGATGTSYYDDITIAKVREGVDAVTGYLSNESHTVPADYNGNVLNYSGAGGQFVVMEGGIEVTNQCQFSIVAASSNTVSNIHPTNGTYTVSAMPSNIDQAAFTLRALYNGITIDKVFTVTKSKQGTPGSGSSGTNGTRGSMTFYVQIGGAQWVDATADAAANGAPGGKVLNDTVTEYNNLAAFSETRFWNGSAWIKVNAVVDGNLLVTGTVGAAAISSHAIEAYHMKVGTITAASGVVSDLDAAVLKSGFIDANRIKADTISTPMIISESATALAGFTRNAGDTSPFFTFAMKSAGVVMISAQVAYTATVTNLATVLFDFFVRISELGDNPTWKVRTTGIQIAQHSGVIVASLPAGIFTAEVYGFCNQSSGTHAFGCSVLRSYR